MAETAVAPSLLFVRFMAARHTLRLGLILQFGLVALFGIAGCSESHTNDTLGPDASLLPPDGSLLPPDGSLLPPDGSIFIHPDGGLGPHDAGSTLASDCSGLGPAACLGAGCVPDFDDVCCSFCAPGACADCTNITYESCQAPELACDDGVSCGTPPAWVCEPATPTCDDANVVDFDSCTRIGCVPAYPSSEGEADPSLARCVPILAESCTVGCRSLPPPCPSGTTPEGDGFCYTGLCIPSFVCE